MRKQHTFLALVGTSLALLAAVKLPLPTASADELEQAIDLSVQAHREAEKSQKKIDNLHDKTQDLLTKYREVLRETESLRLHNEQLTTVVASQAQEKLSLQAELKSIEETQREIVPLMNRMVDSLAEFIELDVPFLSHERSERVSKLRETLTRSDVSTAEKFRRLLEAYQIENDYGRTIEAYRAELEQTDGAKTVDFLRIGRLALYYRSLDGNTTGRFDKQKKHWTSLSSEFDSTLRKGLRIANKQAAPDLLTLPVEAPKEGK